MTSKELRKLGRHDLLQMLVEQSKEVTALQTELEEKAGEIAQLEGGNGRLKEKLDEKDALIEKLKKRLDEKDRVQEEEMESLQEGYNHLKDKLNEKDALIEKLKERLDEKDALIVKLKERLDEKDGKIQGLKEEAAQLRAVKWDELEEKGLMTPILSVMRQHF